jgi:hypothetical protein
MSEINLINREMALLKEIFLKVIKIVPSFDLTDAKILPYGLKPHTRSVSWIVEQVITQQAKFNATNIGVDDVDIDLPDTCLHDCIMTIGDIKYYINIKITKASGKPTRNDISAVEKLYMQYVANPDYRLIYAVFGFEFDNINISFVKDSVHLFSPQFLPIYVNPRNDKIQALYKTEPQLRTRAEFLTLLKENSKSIAL